MLITLTTTLY